METITISKKEFEEILDIIAEYNETDETAFGGAWEQENGYFLEIARKGVAVLTKYGRTPSNDFETQQT